MHQYVRVSNEVEIRRFLRDLKEALKKSRRNAGGYSCFLENDAGDTLLQIEVALPVGGLVR